MVTARLFSDAGLVTSRLSPSVHSVIQADPAPQEACSSPPCPLGGADVALQEGDRSVRMTPWVGVSKTFDALNRLRLHRTLCDVILCCEGQELPCHRAVLASFSPYFEAMFTSGTEESTQDRVTIREEPQMIALLVNYAYTSEVSFCADNVQALLAASDLLEMVGVREACCEYMKDIKRWENREATGLLLYGRGADVYVDPEHRSLGPMFIVPSETENYWDPDHKNKLLEGLNRLRLNGVLCDVILCCEGQEVPCHRAVLATLSPYFEAMFTSGMRESTQDRVNISGVEPQAIGVLVNYAYTGVVSTTKAHMQALLAAAVMFDVTVVREECSNYMERHVVDIDNCVEMYCFAEARSCEGLQTKSLHYIEEHFSVVYQQEEFLSLSVERLTEVLSSDHLNVPEEDMVFEAAMLWLDKSPTHRQSFGQVLEHIRLPLISPSYLHTVVKSLEVVKEQPGCQRFISEAKGEQPYSNTARPRSNTVIVAVGEKMYQRNTVDSLEIFDPLTKEWRTAGDLPMKSERHAMVASGSTLYLSGGDRFGRMRPTGKSSEMWRFDARNETWLKMASMKEEHIDFSLVMLDGYIFAVGGWGRAQERYDPSTDTWELMKDIRCPIGCDVVALDGHLYFIADLPRWPPDKPGGQLAKYNPKTSVWTQLAPMQIPRRHSAACVLNGKIYVTGGLYEREGYGEAIAETVECYNPQTDRWTMCAPFGGRLEHSAVVDKGKIYVLGGNELGQGNYNNTNRDAITIECYCEETDTWEKAGETPDPRFSISCVSLKLPRYHGYDLECGDDDAQYSPSGDEW